MTDCVKQARIFVPIKAESQRVPNKNFRDFGGLELWKRCIAKFQVIAPVFVNTDSERIIEEIEGSSYWSNTTVIRRTPDLCGHEMSVNTILHEFVTSEHCSQNDVVAQVHVTSPFLEANTVKRAIGLMHEGAYDSVVGCNMIQSRLWRDDGYGMCPVNHNPLKLEQTQELPVFFEENSALYVFRPEQFLARQNRVGQKPFFMEVGWPQNLDIDTEDNWQMCVSLLPMLG